MVAPTILWRYILRDTLMHTLLGLFAFTVLLVGQNVMRLLDDLLAAGVSAGTLASLVAVVLPSYLAYAIPTSLLFGVLLTFGRLSADGEVVAIRAAGISVPRLLPPVLALGLVCAAATGYLQFELEPASRHKLKTLVKSLAGALEVIEPGEFKNLGGRTVYVAERGDETCRYRGVLIGDLTERPRPVFISARCAGLENGDGGLGLELRDGSIHFSDTRDDRYRHISFAKMRIGIATEDYMRSRKRGRDYTYAELLELKRQFARGEQPVIRSGHGETTVDVQLHRRVAFSLASVFLGLLAVPLGVRPLRTGRSAGAIVAIGLMALYWLLFAAGEMTAERGLVPVWLGVWTANIVVCVVSVLLIRATDRGDT